MHSVTRKIGNGGLPTTSISLPIGTVSLPTTLDASILAIVTFPAGVESPPVATVSFPVSVDCLLFATVTSPTLGMSVKIYRVGVFTQELAEIRRDALNDWINGKDNFVRHLNRVAGKQVENQQANTPIIIGAVR